MRDTTADTAAAAKTKPTGRVSMTKNVRPARPVRPVRAARPPVENIKPPRTIDYASVAILAMVVANAAYALLVHFASTATLTAYAIKANAKKPVKDFDAAKTVSTFRSSAILSAIIIGLALVLLVWALRRTRSASASRWAMLIVFVFTGLPLQVIPTSGLPRGPQVAAVVVGVAAIATLLLVFIPRASMTYFKACREANIPEELRGQPRPGLGSLFGPKRPRGGAAATTPSPAAAKTAAPTRPATAAPKSKAKVRSDSDAIAKGAELARSRAKASKSRRTTD